MADRSWSRRSRTSVRRRRGAVAVEAAFVLPVALVFLFGIWEVGRLVQVYQVLYNAAREGARLAAGGTNAGTSVTAAMTQTAVQNYLTTAGLPSAAAGRRASHDHLPGHAFVDRPLQRPAAGQVPSDGQDSLGLALQ